MYYLLVFIKFMSYENGKMKKKMAVTEPGLKPIDIEIW